MPMLVESRSVQSSLTAVATISQTLAEHMERLPPRPDGFTVEDYFSLDGAYQLEYVDGRLQVLPMPDALHQSLIGWLLIFLKPALARIDPGARFKFAVFKVMLDATRYREPDVCVMLGKNAHRRHSNYWDGCDLAIEIVSESNADHDWETKRTDYAVAGVPEYWRIDPDNRTLTQFVLPDGQTTYAGGQTFTTADTVHSHVVMGLTVDVGVMFAEAESQVI